MRRAGGLAPKIVGKDKEVAKIDPPTVVQIIRWIRNAERIRKHEEIPEIHQPTVVEVTGDAC